MKRLKEAILFLMDEIYNTLEVWATNLVPSILEGLKFILGCIIAIATIIVVTFTTPLWILPYAIYKGSRK